MYLRKINIKKDGKSHYYWALVESYRTERGPRQRIVSYLGDVDKNDGFCIRDSLERVNSYQQDFFSEQELPERIAINPRKVRTERHRDFGGVWLGKKLYELLGLDRLFADLLDTRSQEINWSLIIEILIISRFYSPSSELHIAEHSYAHSAFEDLLGVPSDKIYDTILYRCLDKVLPYKDHLQKHLKERMGTLFSIEYDLFLYDVTSTYFEGSYISSTIAQRGYSRDKRSDCKQICIALVVTREGLPLGYELFAGNRHDSTTVEEIVDKMENLYGSSRRIWVMDRGMLSVDNIEYLKEEKRKFIIGSPKSTLKKVEQHLLNKEWKEVRPGVEVKLCPSPYSDDELFILCRSKDRAKKESAILERFVQRIEKGIFKLIASCEKKPGKDITSNIERRLGRLLEKNSRASSLFAIDVYYDKSLQKTCIASTKKEKFEEWAIQSEGCYLLRTNITDWEPEDLWKAYIHLTDAEESFRIHKSDLTIRPVWHKKDNRIDAHIFVCFLAFVLWKTMAQICKTKGLGNEPRRVIEEIKKISMVDVVLTTTIGKELKIRTITKPEKETQILLQKLGWVLPETLTKRFL